MHKNRDLKVLYLLHTSQWHGANISFYNMISGLKKKYPIKIYVYVPINQRNLNIDFIHKLENINCKIIYGIIGSSAINDSMSKKDICFFVFNLLFRFFSFIHLFIITILIRPNLVHTNVGIIQEGYFVSKVLKIKHVWHLREYQDLDFHWRIIPSKEKISARYNKSRVIAISEGIAKHFHIANDFEVIYNPISDNVKYFNNKKKDFYFIISNRISKEKGIEDILEAFSVFIKNNNSKYKLLIAGNGNQEYLSYLTKKCEKLGISSNTRFLGYIQDLDELQSNAIALLVGSYFEGFGRMTAESILKGTFVIGRNTGGTKEIIEKTGGGCLFNNVSELIEAMNYVDNLYSTGAYSEVMINGYENAKKIFSYDQSIDSVWNLYRR